MLDPALVLLIIAAALLLFGSAAWHKLRAPLEFAGALEAYRVLPTMAVGLVRWLVPLAELAVAVGVLWAGTRPAAAVLGAGLLIAYAAGIGINLRRGRRHIDCGCAAFGARRAIAPWMVWRNGLLAATLLLLLLPATARSLEWTDFCTVVAALLTVSLLYLSADLLLGQSVRRAAVTGADA
jgi:hypothetical protein